MTSRLKLWGGLILLFCAGALAGAVADSMFLHAESATSRERGPAAHHERIMKRLTEGLSLTPEQQAEIEPIVSRAHVALLELRFAHQVEVEQILGRGMADLKTKLSPSQQSELDRMYNGLERRWQGSRDYLEAQKRKLAFYGLTARP
jgi:Spy/CpxP family protein refolding chaperone